MYPFAGGAHFRRPHVAGLLALIGVAALAAPGDDPAGKAVRQAIANLNRTPHHEYMTTTSGATAGGTQQRELICTADAIYFKSHDQWKRSPMTPQMMGEQEEENFRNAKVYRCQFERNDVVAGETAAVYKAHAENEESTSDAEIWISKSRGLPLRESIDMGDKTHMAITFDYSNVQAPAVK
jgi:outer membrane lipoprotein-sorting protein